MIEPIKPDLEQNFKAKVAAIRGLEESGPHWPKEFGADGAEWEDWLRLAQGKAQFLSGHFWSFCNETGDLSDERMRQLAQLMSVVTWTMFDANAWKYLRLLDSPVSLILAERDREINDRFLLAVESEPAHPDPMTAFDISSTGGSRNG